MSLQKIISVHGKNIQIAESQIPMSCKISIGNQYVLLTKQELEELTADVLYNYTFKWTPEPKAELSEDAV